MAQPFQEETEIEWAGHEVVTGHDLCPYCSKMGFGSFDKLVSCSAQGQSLSENYSTPVYKSSSQQVIRSHPNCWLCRLLYRFFAHTFPPDLFARWRMDNVEITFVSYPGIWKSQLLMTGEREASEIAFMVRSDVYYGNCFYLSCYPRNRPVARNIDEHAPSFAGRIADVERMKSWIAMCQAQHSSCAKRQRISSSPEFQLDLIDVQTREIVTVKDDCRYISLSFVWGENPLNQKVPGAPNNTTVVDIIRESRKYMRLPTMIPATFEDAVSIAQSLGEQYLWIDCFCIDQDDPQLKRTAIENMDVIYSNAYLTICVIDTDSVFNGIPGVRTPHHGRKITVVETEDSRYVATHIEYMHSFLVDCNWSARAWCFQEGAMSHRRLFFSLEGCFFHCKEEIYHDILVLDTSDSRLKCTFDQGNDYALSMGIDLDKDNWAFGDYDRLVTTYSRRAMSFQSDALNAISGGLRMVSRNTGMDFIYAIPVQDMINGLLWLHPRPATLDGPYARMSELHDANNHRRADFPSWSWIGWQAPAKYAYWLLLTRHSSSEQTLKETRHVYSLNQNRGYNHRDIIQLLSCASVDTTASHLSQAVLTLKTQTISLGVAHVSEPKDYARRPFPERRAKSGDHWLILDIHGAPIVMQDIHSFASDTLLYIYYDADEKKSFCSINVHCCDSDRLLEKRTDSLEFMLLQHWKNIASDSQKEDFYRDPTALDISKFTERVWVMAIVRNQDGYAERLAITWIPSQQWFEAGPKNATVHLV